MLLSPTVSKVRRSVLFRLFEQRVVGWLVGLLTLVFGLKDLLSNRDAGYQRHEFGKDDD